MTSISDTAPKLLEQLRLLLREVRAVFTERTAARLYREADDLERRADLIEEMENVMARPPPDSIWETGLNGASKNPLEGPKVRLTNTADLLRREAERKRKVAEFARPKTQ